MRSAICGLSALSGVMMASALSAGVVESSVRPIERPAIEGVELASVSVSKHTRPQGRPLTSDLHAASVRIDTPAAGFESWVQEFNLRAQSQGIEDQVLRAAFDGVTYDPNVIKRDRNQSEFSKTIWQYLDSAVSDARIRNGKAALARHGDILDDIEARYGVEKEVVVAIWGLESAYGSYRGSNDVVRSLATLAYDGRRGAFFEQQLVAALKILQSGDTAPRMMTGSWAGAMGHTQFIPTSYLDFAVDFTGDGRRDIWSDDPTDALASAAAYLKQHGWVTGQPWGVEVTLPAGFDYRLANRKITKSASEWADIGVLDVNGRAVADRGAASVLLPAGAEGAAFMIFENFGVIERYNAADAYVIGVGHLSDRIAGGQAIQSDWPRDDRGLSFDERKELQNRLTERGFDTQGIDGRVGPLTIDAVRRYQVSAGLTADGYPSLSLLNTLR